MSTNRNLNRAKKARDIAVGMDGKTEHIRFKVVGVEETKGRGYSNGLFTGEGTVCPLVNGKGKFTRVFIQKVKS